MRPKSVVVLAVFLCLLLPAIAGADSISGLSPTNYEWGVVEQFLTIRGTGLAGGVATLVSFSSPFVGTVENEPSILDPNGTYLQVYVPDALLFEEGTVTVTVKAIDATGVRLIGPATFTVARSTEPQPPLLSLPEVVVAPAESARGGVATFEVSAINPITLADVPVTCDHESGSQFPLGPTLVSCSAVDNGLTAQASFWVYIADRTPPVLTLPDDITSDNPVVTFSPTAVDDIDGAVTVTCNPHSGSTFAAGTTEVVCFATDSQLNYAFGSFNVHVTGGAPRLTVPDDITAEATSPAGAPVTFNVTVEEASSYTCSPASGATFPLGDTLVTCTATNSVGTSSASFTVTVQDSTPPAITAPDMIVEATSAAGATVTYSAAATDLVDGAVTLNCTPASGSQFPLGTTQVDCTATDLHGNEASASFNVSVVDTTPPTIVGLAASQTLLWPPDHRMESITLTGSAFDLVDPDPVLMILSVTSNQPDNGTGDGDVAGDSVITGPMSVDLRAERSHGVDRIYTITVQATDASGNSATSTIQVKVTQAPARRR